MDVTRKRAAPTDDPPLEPAKASQRVVGVLYRRKNGELEIWTGNRWYCEHNRVRNKCKECGGASICEHGKRRNRCKECGGASICEHGKERNRCKECGGVSICEHGKQRHQCKECGGASICEHGKQRSQCKECGGASFCEHGKQRSRCKECGGASFCEHGIERRHCTECLSLEQTLKSSNFCSICGTTRVGRVRRYTRICAGCEKDRPPRLEDIVWDEIKDELPIPTYADNRLIGGIDCAADRTRPDRCWILTDRIVHWENDEHSHEDRAISCELKKLDSANWGLSGFGHQHLPTWTVRFNCSEYDGRRISLKERCKKLQSYLQNLLTESTAKWDPLRTNVTYMYYHSRANAHIQAAQSSMDSIVVQEIIQ